MTTDIMNVIIKSSGAGEYVNAMNQCKMQTELFRSAVSKLTSAFSIAAITKFAKDCVGAASDLAEVQNVVDVAFGNMSQSVSDWAKNEAQNFGLSEVAAKRYAGYIGSMATQFGFTNEQAAEMAKTLTGLTGDVASFYNMTDQLAYTKIKSIFSGETETLKEIGVVMTQSALDAYAMANGFGKTTKQMTEQEKVALRYQFVLDKLSNANGDFARTSDGFANSGRSLTLQLQDLKTEIGQELMPAAQDLMQLTASGLSVISPVLKDVAHGVAYVASAFSSLDAETKILSSDVVRYLSPVAAVIGGLTGNWIVMSIGIAGTLGALTRTEEAMEGSSKSASAFADSTDKISDSLNSLGASSASLDTFLAGFDEVNKIGKGTGSTAFSSIINDTDVANASELSDIIDGISDSLSSGMTLGIDFDKSIIDGLNLVNDKIADILSSDWTNFWGNVGEKAYEFKNSWVNALESVGEKLYDFMYPDRKDDGGKSHTSAKNKSHGGGGSSFDIEGASENSKSGYSHNGSGSSIDETIYYRNNLFVGSTSTGNSKKNNSLNIDTGTHSYFGLQNALNSLKSTVESTSSLGSTSTGNSKKSNSLNTDSGTHSYFGLQSALNSLKTTVSSASSLGSTFAENSKKNYSLNTDTGTHSYFGLQNAFNSLKSTVESATSQKQQQPINITVKTTLDGKEVANSVINNINAQTRSNGKSPLTDY